MVRGKIDASISGLSGAFMAEETPAAKYDFFPFAPHI
jgi:hypothetical protein